MWNQAIWAVNINWYYWCKRWISKAYISNTETHNQMHVLSQEFQMLIRTDTINDMQLNCHCWVCIFVFRCERSTWKSRAKESLFISGIYNNTKTNWEHTKIYTTHIGIDNNGNCHCYVETCILFRMRKDVQKLGKSDLSATVNSIGTWNQNHRKHERDSERKKHNSNNAEFFF